MDNTDMQKFLPVSIKSFRLIREKYIYADKTALIARFAQTATTVFLARPRRFGKSLLISTLQSLFEDGLKYFSGLEIDKLNLWPDQKTYKVIRLDFSTYRGKTAEDFRYYFKEDLLSIACSLNIQFPARLLNDSTTRPSLYLQHILKQGSYKSYVLLIDEYDSPLTEAMHEADKYAAIKEEMARCFSLLKSYAECLRFVFITGITRLASNDLLSACNDIIDISMNPAYSTLLGYTEQETDRYFGAYLSAAARKSGISVNELKRILQACYGGYCFDERCTATVYNPWSVLNFLKDMPQDSYPAYWYDTGGVSPLTIHYFKELSALQDKRTCSLSLIDDSNIRLQEGISISALKTKPVLVNTDYRCLMQQTGYLTIRQSNGARVTLGIPNLEIRRAITELFFHHILQLNEATLQKLQTGRKNCMQALSDPSELYQYLNTVLSIFSCDTRIFACEDALRDLLLNIFVYNSLIACKESRKARGRAELMVELPHTRYVLNLKIARPGDKPEQQLLQALTELQEAERDFINTWPAKELVCYAIVISGTDKNILYLQQVPKEKEEQR